MSGGVDRCVQCGGTRIWGNYVGDIIGPLCQCPAQAPRPHWPAPVQQFQHYFIPSLEDIRRVVREEIERAHGIVGGGK